MATKKTSKSHTSARKKASASATSRAKKAASKTTKSAKKPKLTKKQKDELDRRKLEKLTLELWRRTYDDYQAGKFRLLFR